MKYLDLTGLQELWTKVKNHVQTSLQGYAKTTDIPDTSNFVTKDENGGVLIQTKQGNNTIEVYEDEQESYISIGSNALGLHGVANISTHDGNYGENGQVLMKEGGLVTWGNPPGGTSSGDSSIIDLGTTSSHKEAQQAIVDHLIQMNAEDGCYLFKYYCSCYGNACFAVVKMYNFEAETLNNLISIEGTVYDSYYSYREFKYNSDDGFWVDGCWEQIGTSSGGAGLSMPRIRLANWKYTEIPTFGYNEDGNEYFISGGIAFSVNVQDGTVQEGDELQVCSLRTTFGKRKLRPILSKTITSEDLENLTKQPYLKISTDNVSSNNLGSDLERAMQSFYYTDSKTPEKCKPKYIRIRRPIYTEEGEVANAYFSNVVPVDIRLRKYFLE